MLEKGTLHFHDFDHISKTYPLQSFKKKEVFKDGSGYEIRGIPVNKTKKLNGFFFQFLLEPDLKNSLD